MALAGVPCFWWSVQQGSDRDTIKILYQTLNSTLLFSTLLYSAILKILGSVEEDRVRRGAVPRVQPAYCCWLEAVVGMCTARPLCGLGVVVVTLYYAGARRGVSRV